MISTTFNRFEINANLSKFSRGEVAGWFQESLDGIGKLIGEQLDAAKEQEKSVQVKAPRN